jgi:hypothetical protein
MCGQLRAAGRQTIVDWIAGKLNIKPDRLARANRRVVRAFARYFA